MHAETYTLVFSVLFRFLVFSTKEASSVRETFPTTISADASRTCFCPRCQAQTQPLPGTNTLYTWYSTRKTPTFTRSSATPTFPSVPFPVIMYFSAMPFFPAFLITTMHLSHLVVCHGFHVSVRHLQRCPNDDSLQVTEIAVRQYDARLEHLS